MSDQAHPTCQALRRDGSRCPNPSRVMLFADPAYTARVQPHRRNRPVHLCGQHHNALGKGIMVVPLVADPGRRDAFVAADREGRYFFGDFEELGS